MPTDSRKPLKKLLQRLFPSAKLKLHKYGVLLARKGFPDQLVCCGQGNVRPFHLEVVRETWDALWVAAARLRAELAFAIPDPAGVSLQLLPLSAADLRAPGWPPVVESRVYDEEEDEWVHVEVRRVPLAIGKQATVLAHRWTEAEIQQASVEWLRSAHSQLVMFSVPVEAAIKQWGKFSKTGATAGVADTCVLLPGGATLFVEFKRTKGSLRESQEAFQSDCRRLGHRYEVVRSLAEFQELISRAVT